MSPLIHIAPSLPPSPVQFANVYIFLTIVRVQVFAGEGDCLSSQKVHILLLYSLYTPRFYPLSLPVPSLSLPRPRHTAPTIILTLLPTFPGHGSSSPSIPPLFSCGTTVWVLSLIVSKNTTGLSEVSISTRPSLSSSLEATTTRSKYGLIRRGAVFSH